MQETVLLVLEQEVEAVEMTTRWMSCDVLVVVVGLQRRRDGGGEVEPPTSSSGRELKVER